MRQRPRQDEPLNEPALQAPPDVTTDDLHEQDPAEFLLLVGVFRLLGVFARLIASRGLEQTGDARLEGVVECRLDLVQAILPRKRDGFVSGDLVSLAVWIDHFDPDDGARRGVQREYQLFGLASRVSAGPFPLGAVLPPLMGSAFR